MNIRTIIVGVVASTAIVAGVPSVTVAATTPATPPGSVTSTTIKDGTIQMRDLSLETKEVLTRYQAKDSITTKSIKNGSIKLEDLHPLLRQLILQGCQK